MGFNTFAIWNGLHCSTKSITVLRGVLVGTSVKGRDLPMLIECNSIKEDRVCGKRRGPRDELKRLYSINGNARK